MKEVRISKKDINVFLAAWIKSDPKLWGHLKKFQIKLLVDRIIHERTYRELSKQMKVRELVLRKLLRAVINKIERVIDPELAEKLRLMNFLIENKHLSQGNPVYYQN